MVRCMKHAIHVAFLLAAISVNAQAADVRPIVVELYTSQSCSSCPPADAVLNKLAQRKGVIALSLPITYWDMLGWKDTLASEADTRRQNAYAAAMGHGGVYTPQLIIDGVTDVVGAREPAVDQAIAAAMQSRDDGLKAVEHARAVVARNDAVEPSGALTLVAGLQVRPAPRPGWSVGVDLSRTPRSLHVTVGGRPEAAGGPRLDATIWLFRVRSSVTVHIGAGENEGRTETYRNVVTNIKDIGRWRGKPISLDVPHADAKTPLHDGVAVVVQEGGYGRVIGAAFLDRATYYAEQ
jgi:hypothetical protein